MSTVFLSCPANTIHIEEWLDDPLKTLEVIEIQADTKFAVELLPILSKTEVQVQLSLEGNASSPIIDGPAPWTLEGKSLDRVIIPINGTAFLEHTYPVEGMSERLGLRVRYAVSDSEVKVERLWLVSLNAMVVNNNQSEMPGSD